MNLITAASCSQKKTGAEPKTKVRKMDQKTQHSPTPEQQVIIDAAERGESFSVYAGAGTAKTTTLKMLSQNLTTRSILGVAFNVKIVEDLTAAMPERAVVKTLNGLGHGAWAKQRGKFLQLDKTKLTRVVSEVFKRQAPDIRAADEDGSCWNVVRDYVRMLRMSGYVPSHIDQKPQLQIMTYIDEAIDEFMMTHEWDLGLMPVDQLLELADEALAQSIQEGFTTTIDFDDQIYLSTMFFCPYPQFDTVLVDEAQDLSPMNHIQLLKCKPKQLIAVGDPRQAIYAFRGADSDSMDNLKRKVDKTGLHMGIYPLATSFRCPKAVVARQLNHYPEFRAFETNAEGEIKTISGPWEIKDLPEGCAVICRNNAPLVALAFALLANRRGFNYIGVDMSKNLKSLIKKVAGFTGKTLNKSQERIPSEKVIEQVKAWYLNESLRLTNAGRNDLISQLTDKKACCLIILKQSKDLGTALALCDSLFTPGYGITLVTGHRAKGLEWKDVWHLDPWRIPSKYAKLAAQEGSYGQLRQEQNLKYVIETRTKFSLTMMDLKLCKDAPPEDIEE